MEIGSWPETVTAPWVIVHSYGTTGDYTGFGEGMWGAQDRSTAAPFDETACGSLRFQDELP